MSCNAVSFLCPQAYLALADYVECETDIKRALAEDPKNVGVRLLQKEYKQKVGPATLLHVEAAMWPHTSATPAAPCSYPRESLLYMDGTEKSVPSQLQSKVPVLRYLTCTLQSAESREQDKALFSRMFKPPKARMVVPWCQPSSGLRCMSVFCPLLAVALRLHTC